MPGAATCRGGGVAMSSWHMAPEEHYKAGELRLQEAERRFAELLAESHHLSPAEEVASGCQLAIAHAHFANARSAKKLEDGRPAAILAEIESFINATDSNETMVAVIQSILDGK